MTCSRCNQDVRRIYSIASDGSDDYMPSCGCVDWDGVVAILLVLLLLGEITIGLLVS